MTTDNSVPTTETETVAGEQIGEGLTVTAIGHSRWQVNADGYVVGLANIEIKGAAINAIVTVDDADGNNLSLDTLNLASSYSRTRIAKGLKERGADLDIDRVIRAFARYIRIEFEQREAMMASAPPVSEMPEADRETEAEQALAESDGLLDDPDLWKRITDAIIERGYAGDVRPPGAAYLGMTSRLGQEPANIAYIAQSSSGKTFAVKAATEFFPSSAYYEIDGMSPRALLLSPASFEHRIIIIGEADSLVEDGPAASTLRSIITESKTVYEITVQGEDGKYTTDRIEKRGPTGAITTSTRPLPAQFNTRMLPLTVRDDPGQIGRVLHVLADKKNGAAPDFDLTPFVAVQRWLELAGDHEAMIPFSHDLADLVPHNDPRMNRDFAQMLTFIEASAILHQRQRSRDDRGRIIATEQDYAIVRDLLCDSFTAAASAGLTTIVREAVEALARLCEDAEVEGQIGFTATNTAVADAVGVPKGTMKYRLDRALALGYIINKEEKKGRPGRFQIGDPLPDEKDALPTVEVLFSVSPGEDSTDSTTRPLPGSPVLARNERSSADSTGLDRSDQRSNAVESRLDRESGVVIEDAGSGRVVESVEWGTETPSPALTATVPCSWCEQPFPSAQLDPGGLCPTCSPNPMVVVE